MKAVLLLAMFLSSLVVVSCDLTCSAYVTLKPRDGSWFEGPIQFQIYDIVVHNTGTCSLLSLFVWVDTFPLGVGEIIQSENYDPSTGELTFVGGVLPPDQYFSGAGFIVAGPPSTVPFIISYSPKCKCPNFEICEGIATITARHGGSYYEDNKFHRIWDIAVTNTGSLKIDRAVLTIDFPFGADDTSGHWNIEPVGDDKYILNSHGTLYPGHTFNGAGFVLKSTVPKYPPPIVALHQMTCI